MKRIMKGEPRLSFRKLGHLLKAKGIMAGIKLHQSPLPPVVVVDESWVRVGERGLGSMWPWIPAPFFVRDEANTNAFLEHLVEAYGEWPKLVITETSPPRSPESPSSRRGSSSGMGTPGRCLPGRTFAGPSVWRRR